MGTRKWEVEKNNVYLIAMINSIGALLPLRIKFATGHTFRCKAFD